MPGLLQLTTPIMRFQTEPNPLTDEFVADVTDVIRRASFAAMVAQGEEGVGLTSIDNPLDSAFIGGAIFGDTVAFKLRRDEKKIPSAILKHNCMQEEARVKEIKGVPRLSRNHRAEIKENERLRLLAQIPPTPSTFDVVWDVKTGTVYMFSSAVASMELLENTFATVFKQRLRLVLPAHVIARTSLEMATNIHDADVLQVMEEYLVTSQEWLLWLAANETDYQQTYQSPGFYELGKNMVVVGPEKTKVSCVSALPAAKVALADGGRISQLHLNIVIAEGGVQYMYKVMINAVDMAMRVRRPRSLKKDDEGESTIFSDVLVAKGTYDALYAFIDTTLKNFADVRFGSAWLGAYDKMAQWSEAEE